MHCICRTNATIMEGVLQVLGGKTFPLTAAMVSGAKVWVDESFYTRYCQDGMKGLRTLCLLKKGQIHDPIVKEHPYIKHYSFPGGFEAYYKSMEARAYRMDRTASGNIQDTSAINDLAMARLVKGDCDNIYAMLDSLQTNIKLSGSGQDRVPNVNALNLHFHTAHGAKGATYQHVYVADGFYLNPLEATQEQKNILYVALTRAQRSCYVQEDTFEVAFEARQIGENSVQTKVTAAAAGSRGGAGGAKKKWREMGFRY